ncbi:hypothetical protein FRB94_006563 [Tulasnella sp. JGI-2019a]|nr:hypothetical protein FRB93_012096 [Tulasnella sp. JGI-2019a]KAG9012195.1 hypothetical protein FRB94_006563 [Tulasnella sp. JGI-2019a]KAG9036344.1 hypothetical protein FRB95_009266 [Tulasnella sp. JGI-2019a]
MQGNANPANRDFTADSTVPYSTPKVVQLANSNAESETTLSHSKRRTRKRSIKSAAVEKV